MTARLKTFLKIAIDLVIIGLCYYLAFFIQFEGRLPVDKLEHAFYSLFIVMIANIFFLFIFNVYRNLIIYLSISELTRIAGATGVACLSSSFIIRLFTDYQIRFSVCIINWLLLVIMLNSVRIIYRFTLKMLREQVKQKLKRALIIGAGDAGEMIIGQMHLDQSIGYKPVGLLDDDPGKYKMIIHKVPVIGTTEDLEKITRELKIDEIVIAIPSATNEQMRKIIKKCENCGIPFKTLPSKKEIFNGHAKEHLIRNIKLEDMLGRDPIVIDRAGVMSFIRHKTIFVTGAGGSIGSELCKQLLQYQPAQIVLYDKSENEIFKLTNELSNISSDYRFHPVVANILDQGKLEWALKQFKPNVIFHAAAHKHVPLMEVNAEEAIKNNTIGTIKVALAALNLNIEKFIFISTDKAVYPSSIMGASKRICEIFLQNLHHLSPENDRKTNFIIVRFGNVLGSNGSVVPIFQRQIEAGGPVKITNPKMTRFFMTITEAVELILQAATLGQGGEIFIMDMGKPIKIVELANFIISSYGYRPGIDIKIEFTGDRPGEKIHEKLWYKNENPGYIINKKLFVAMPLISNLNGFYGSIQVLKNCAVEMDRFHLLKIIKKLIHEYKPSAIAQHQSAPYQFNDKQLYE